ncbi:hypothetical protein EB810_06675 [Altererythrobacter sp. FM1]|uniref:restriction endonuclease subunit S n=1 Tax=Tsuneonella flava TaxID=2055955 RepID=UPI000C80B381|nr:restriction endonuclease subunit S [Tsuneonella flava]ROT94837.1 hypothetical protein EB810_06675 [Altererythrobacter sp. FM1]
MSGEQEGTWASKSLGDLFAVNTPGHWGDEPEGHGNILVLRSTNFRKAGGLIYETAAPRQFDARKLAQKRLQAGDIILERSGGSPAQPVGRARRFEAEGCYSASNFMQIMRPSDKVDNWFACYLLDYLYDQGHTEPLQKATTGIRNLDFKTYLHLPVSVPSLDEQRRIAEVLRSVDEAIAATQATYDGILTAQAAVFQSFLQSGERVPHSQPIISWMTGKISGVDQLPPGWRIVRLVEVARLESGHTPDRKKPEYWDGGDVEWISLHDTQNLERCDISHTEMRITEAGLANSSARLLPAGTVCFSRTATVGKCVIMAKSMATSQDFANFVCSPELNNRYLLHLMRWMQPVWKALASGSTHKTIYMPTFKALQIILPSRAEQDEIAATMDSFVNTAEGHAASLTHLRSLKANLMSDLLSGRVRVRA